MIFLHLCRDSAQCAVDLVRPSNTGRNVLLFFFRFFFFNLVMRWREAVKDSSKGPPYSRCPCSRGSPEHWVCLVDFAINIGLVSVPAVWLREWLRVRYLCGVS